MCHLPLTSPLRPLIPLFHPLLPSCISLSPLPISTPLPSSSSSLSSLIHSCFIPSLNISVSPFLLPFLLLPCIPSYSSPSSSLLPSLFPLSLALLHSSLVTVHTPPSFLLFSLHLLSPWCLSSLSSPYSIFTSLPSPKVQFVLSPFQILTLPSLSLIPPLCHFSQLSPLPRYSLYSPSPPQILTYSPHLISSPSCNISPLPHETVSPLPFLPFLMYTALPSPPMQLKNYNRE